MAFLPILHSLIVQNMEGTLRRKILSHFNSTSLSGVAFKDHSRRKRIIEQLSGIEEITINEISESLNISVPKATELLAELAKVGFVKERGKRSEGQAQTVESDSIRSRRDRIQVRRQATDQDRRRGW